MSIGICIVTNELFYQTKFCIENLLDKTGSELRLYIVDNGSKNEKLTDYLQKITEENKWYYKHNEKPLPLNKVYNNLIGSVYQKYCCLFPINTIVNNNWAEDLVSNYIQSQNTGIIGIRNGTEKVSFKPILYDCEVNGDYLKNVWVTENGTVEGLVMFETEKIYEFGYFDEFLNAPGLELNEYSFRYMCQTLNNFYIPKQTCIKVNIENKILFPDITDEAINNLMLEMNNIVKTKSFKK